MRRAIPKGAVLLALASAAGAQEPAPPPERDLVLGFAGPWKLEELREGDRSVTRLLSPQPFRISVAGPVRPVGIDEPLLECGRAVVWASTDAVRRLLGGGGGTPPGGREAIEGSGLVVYAEEEVVFRPGPGRVIRAEALLLDLAAGRSVARKARIRFPAFPGEVPLVADAERVRFEYARGGAEDKVACEEARIGTCSYGHPHYHVGAARLEITGSIGRRALRESPGPEWVTASGLTLTALGVPLLWLPGAEWNLDWDSPIREMDAGRSRAYGPFVRTLLGVSLREGDEGEPGKPPGRRRAGEAGARVEVFGERGGGGGLEGRWQGHGEGRDAFGDRPRTLLLDGLAVAWRDRGDPREEDAPPGLWPVEDHDRWRSQGRAEVRAPDAVRVAGEWHALSDRNVLREFAEDVLKERKDPETYAEAAVTLGPLLAEELLRVRGNDFQTQTEYLPRGRVLLAAFPLLEFGSLQLEGEGASLRRSFDEATSRRPYDARRGDGTATAVLPLLRGPVVLAPFAFARWTGWSRSMTGSGAGSEDVDRVAEGVGVRARTDVHRVYDLGSGVRVRHVITPEVDYRNVFRVTGDPADLLAFDAVEAVREEDRLTARLRTTLEAAGPLGSGPPREILLLEAEGDWWFRPRRDHGDEPAGDIRGEARVSPAGGLSLYARGVYRPPERAVVSWEAGAVWRNLLPGVSVGVSSRNVRDLVHTTAATAAVRMSDRWAASAAVRYDFERGRPEETRVTLRRVLHCWLLEGGVAVDHGERDVSVVVTLLPLGLSDRAGATWAAGGNEPVLGLESR